MKTDQPHTAPAIAPHLTTRFIGDDAFLMNLDTLDTYVLNDTAARVWSLIDGARSEEDIVAAIQAEYDVDDIECAVSVRGLLRDFAEARLIRHDDHG